MARRGRRRNKSKKNFIKMLMKKHDITYTQALRMYESVEKKRGASE